MNEVPPVIGLCGSAGAGKSLAAKIIAEHNGFEIVSFATPLRELAKAVNPVVGYDALGGTPTLTGWFPTGEFQPIYYNDAIADLGYEEAKRVYPELRRFLQRLGTEGGRGIMTDWLSRLDASIAGGSLWTSLFDNEVEYTYSDGVVCDDVRFPNEAGVIRDLDGVIVRIERSLSPRLTGANEAHESETHVIGADITINNDGTEEDLAVALAENGLLDYH